MKKRWMLTILICLSWHCLGAKTDITHVVIATGETPPFTSQNIKHNGYMNHIIRLAFGNVGISTEFIFLPWSRAYLEAQQGEFVATSYWFSDDRHNSHFFFSDPLNTQDVVLFKRRISANSPWQSFDDIRRLQLKVGLTRGYTYNQSTWDYAEQRPDLVSVVNTDLQNLKMLVLKRIDAFPIEEVTGWYMLNRHFPPEQVQMLEIAPQPLTTKTSHLFFSKAHSDSESLLHSFNEGLRQLSLSGELSLLHEALILGEYQ